MFEEIINLMNDVMNERSVPKNVRSKIEESIKNLKDESKDPETRIGIVISTMDEISNDPNLPIYARTMIWNIVSRLESLRAKSNS